MRAKVIRRPKVAARTAAVSSRVHRLEEEVRDLRAELRSLRDLLAALARSPVDDAAGRRRAAARFTRYLGRAARLSPAEADAIRRSWGE